MAARAAAAAASLHHRNPSLLLPRALLLPVLFRQTGFSCNNFRFNQLSSTARFSSIAKPPSIPVRAQAKRSFSFKEEEIATPADLCFEEPLKIVEYPDPILRRKNKRIDTFDDNLKKLVDEMFDVMYKTDGIGLSAPQVGINVQLMVFNPVGERGEGEEIVLINPRLNKYSKKIVPFNEGCLSFPGIYADVLRPESVKIDARDINGARFTVNLSGLPARVFQHEYDHLEGILFFDRMTDEVLDSIRAQLQALEKKFEDKTGYASPEKIETRKTKKAAAGFGKS
ncbi:peptide deformylase 1B, chloroplastic/mitochondrial isoform X2 [Ricinus communis]|uniref:Peptide deformylase n=1 Tax=Ricinus communis TaxID=3988 RepID=B9S632_RICCO|nr:peptide deformylase 1B, chloroplastic/mitochondrial isoform X2 [Ricinus communis]EEF40941.1 polypeptide deformylase, putative [Ricinus communis]|eukprot:XP_002521451.1 peptide deformylase 1B, chloroplastic/mitochondrial isoform X2 [Ricinus communis]